MVINEGTKVKFLISKGKYKQMFSSDRIGVLSAYYITVLRD